MNTIEQPRQAPTLREIEEVALELMEHPQLEMPVTNHFAPGIYGREIFVPAGPEGSFVIGHIHKHPHLNILLSGSMTVICDGKRELLKAPCVFVSGGMVAKVAWVHEDMRFLTIHPLAGLEHCGQDPEKLEPYLIEKSEAYRAKEMELKGRARLVDQTPIEGRVAA